MGYTDKFEQDLQRVSESIDQKDANSFNSVGYLLADSTDCYEESYKFIKHALDLEPENPYFLDSMGWLLYKMGNRKESVNYLQRSVDKQNNPESSAHLGEVLWNSGYRYRYKAEQVWRKALKDFPENEKLKETMKRFMP
ncbi:MAG: hypothetical protein GY795_40110 [Desulfobacterales bacterium]|nr:hypothetical protein [Desulfobacterales bacterium]